MEKLWKDIEGYETLYQISDDGEVMGVKRGKIMKPQANKNYGHYQVLLWKDAHAKLYYVHRLVAQAFVENPHGYRYVTHLDGDIKNNRAENLAWVNKPIIYKRENKKKEC